MFEVIIGVIGSHKLEKGDNTIAQRRTMFEKTKH